MSRRSRHCSGWFAGGGAAAHGLQEAGRAAGEAHRAPCVQGLGWLQELWLGAVGGVTGCYACAWRLCCMCVGWMMWMDERRVKLHCTSQGLAAGLMLSISMLDLLPESVEAIGFVRANLFFYLGVLFFAAVIYIIPEPDASMIVAPPASSRCEGARVRALRGVSALYFLMGGEGLSTRCA